MYIGDRSDPICNLSVEMLSNLRAQGLERGYKRGYKVHGHALIARSYHAEYVKKVYEKLDIPFLYTKVYIEKTVKNDEEVTHAPP